MSLARVTDYLLYQLPMREAKGQPISEKQLADRILIIGSGNLECRIAIDLAEQGKEVTILENSDEILSDCFAFAARAELMNKLENLVVTIVLETSLIAIKKNQVCLCNQDGFESQLTVDNIIVSKNYEYSQNRL
ncbi:FAD-dependent oxidoreductase [Enterococcus crotali]|uniref:FAD-dependent oxidoreductase n=1 Tax=Enterococcus crotali TaxID=1453587 RepID=UPI000471B59D|nr:FAD-dependent oxidoreductase [Enterococcus crotali]